MKTELTAERIRKIQKELHALGVLEEYKEYKVSDEYLDAVIDKYSELEDTYGYIQGAIIVPLFEFIKKKEPHITEEEMMKKVQMLFPVVRSMLDSGKVFEIIKQAKRENKP